MHDTTAMTRHMMMRLLAMTVPSLLEIRYQPAAHDHPAPGHEDQDGDPLGAHRRIVPCLDVPKPVRNGKIEDRDRSDHDESDLWRERICIQIAVLIGKHDQ